MIKKILLLFCCVYSFCLSPSFANGDKIFIDPEVADTVIKKYFGSLVSDQKFNISEIWTDEIILLRVLESWDDCIALNGGLVSTSCISEVCKVAFGHLMYDDTDTKYSLLPQDTNNYCKRFGYELITVEANQQNSNCMYFVTKKDGSQTQIKYTAFDNSGFIRSGGTIPWRFFNPGALRRSSLACTRLNTKPNGYFAVFESYEKGRQALLRVLRSEDYRNLTIAQAISKYAPKHENNTFRYIKIVKDGLKSVRSDVNTLKLRDLTDSQLEVLMDIIQQIEGWNKSGNIIEF